MRAAMLMACTTGRETTYESSADVREPWNRTEQLLQLLQLEAQPSDLASDNARPRVAVSVLLMHWRTTSRLSFDKAQGSTYLSQLFFKRSVTANGARASLRMKQMCFSTVVATHQGCLLAAVAEVALRRD